MQGGEPIVEQEELELVLEAILFASGDPVPVERMSQIVGQRPKAVSQACQSLADRLLADVLGS